MRPNIPTLWSEIDRGAALACRRALEGDDLLGALFAIEGADRLRRIETVARVQAWTAAVAAHPEDRVGALRAVLGRRLRVAPPLNPDPHAAFVSAVSGGSPGLPAIIASLWLVVARGAGVAVRPVALPGRLVLGTDDGRLLDPADEGAEMSERALHTLRRQLDQPARQPPCSMASIVDRALRDLLFCGELAHDDITRFRAVSFLSHLHPDDPGPLVALGMLAEGVGALAYAEALYERVDARFPLTHEAAIARRRRRLMAHEAATLH
ncbi:MAG: hypothetical protein H6702_25430 [Myxococcales bacterium]|nr:hypothetical protein [Myxococcales bacterium]